MRRASRVDSNHAEIVAYFKAHGCEVQSLAALGNDVPDLLVSWGPGADWARLPYTMALVEIKTLKGKRTAGQVEFGRRFPVWLVRSETDAATVIAWLKREWPDRDS